ncbi:hypothetical protein BC831DRAFT_399199 [Entophlyctis helioformis]|nr:hypothetical protein BC831DRAFT_399199 [Entophlyctis helioformis]
MLLLFILQRADYANQSKTTQTPPSAPLPGVFRCQARRPCLTLASATPQGRSASANCINIMYTPVNDATNSFMRTFASLNARRTGEKALTVEPILRSIIPPPRTLDIVPVPSKAFIYNYTLTFPNTTAWGIVFNEERTPDRNIQYQIWYNSSRVNNGSDVYGRQLTAFLRGMDESIISVLNDPAATVTANIDVTLRDWPVVPPAVLSDTIVQNLGAVFFFCSVMVVFINVLNQIVSEKEQKLRLGMEIMGLKPVVYWLGMFLSNSLLVFVGSLFTVILGYIFQFNTFKNTNFAVLLITFFLFGEAMVVFGFFITTFVRRARVAVLVGIFVFIVGLLFESFVFSSGFIGYIWWRRSTSSFVPTILSIFPFFNFGKCFLDISTLTTGKRDDLTGTFIAGPGFGWNNMYNPIPAYLQPTYPDGGKPDIPPTVNAWYALLFDIVLYSVLTWFFDNVIPDEFGYSLPVYFFMLPSYWGFETGKSKAVDRADWLANVFDSSAREPVQEDSDVSVERSRALSEAFWPAGKIVHLRKLYQTFGSKDEKLAIKDLCLTLEEGKLLALLGQNGAGKSTTMNILSGLTPSTSGDALMYGLSVQYQMNRIRKIMGVCPQHDILFSDLTAREHIYLYAAFKGVPREQWDPLANDRLQAVRLLAVADQATSTYSGGMRRRLSLVIATIGDPKIVFLDEPTTGMDPVNRRHVWTFIEKFKAGRIVVLTTHSMEEADVLGDRIAIMAHGRLRAIGNSVTLKSKFGAGYRISIITDPVRADDAKAAVYAQVPAATLEDDSAGALIYQFPVSSTPLIPGFVKYLNANPAGLVRAWGISQTTLEEVFLRIIRDANPGGYMSNEVVILDDAPPVAGTGALRPKFSIRRRNTASSRRTHRSDAGDDGEDGTGTASFAASPLSPVPKVPPKFMDERSPSMEDINSANPLV